MVADGGLDDRFIALARKYNLNPLYLNQIILLRNHGYNNTEIAEKTGISRVTVNNYVDRIGEVEAKDLLKMIAFVLVAAAGIALLESIMGQ